ncbi:MAG: xanthine dehydrogenase family protein molybdopterin-binding subunit [Alphaproteobacteria bacterium]|nr:xanthine dehydrogenase family protein molybdopterin-binding subunit [Alphaproteobacteria bacterium]MBU0797188.1 xanthine dehydrogenase family protein molybdopterin-binding subunit [Alphaproteobacteria bacterium]MBU0887141.1 xanthine dehydrogenase family protein molybdopterin-binding subunit [Alphaproteobacteria bacterium]MBU1814391.1 xanthine dehydrogenase family protein molybdopterin-binding subunit [Alphaproteobacteria bacterium]MBU2089462.1 xanthine dehydrogenase family protein molybdopte
MRLSRRTMLKASAGLVIALQLPLPGRAKAASGAAATPIAPNAFVRVGTDNTVTVLVKHIEFGQGPFTGLSTLVAEELDADWSQMRAEHAPANADLYKNLAFGVQGTGGSTAIANSYQQLRQAGAAARAMLVQAAADSWKVPAGEITVERGVLRHSSGRQGQFGEFAEAAAKLPVPQSVTLKDPSAFRLIGLDNGSIRKLDTPGKTDGTAQFTIDIMTPGMLTVVVARPPRFGATLVSFDDTAARAVKGVVDVKRIPSGIAIYANGTWPALKAREALTAVWDEAKAEMRSTAAMIEEYRALAKTPGIVAGTHGDAAAAFAGGGQVIEAEYVFPYLAHAPMEPVDGYLEWDGQSARARFGSQLQTLDHAIIAKVLDLTPDKVTVETMLGGGSFGRRAQGDAQLAAELAHAARAIGPNRPVKLVWTREDDLAGGYYRSIFVHRLKGSVQDGKITGWSNTIVGQSLATGTPFEAFMVKDGVDATSVEGSKEIPYAIANFRCDLHTVTSPVPVLWWRSVGHTHTGYAVECFIDELLEATGQDPVDGRLALMGKEPRLAGVLRAVARAANWSGGAPVNGRARGVAAVESFGSFVAQIAEVSAGPEGPIVHKVWCAIDCGVAVNPDVIRAQIEGGIGYGLGHVLYAELDLDAGVPVQTNFDSYRSLRIHEMPEIEVVIVASAEPPTGVGEPGVPPVGPAVANAMAKLGMGRPSRLPMVRGMV